jgi:nucleotide-binding universal stress UspA family protein
MKHILVPLNGTTGDSPILAQALRVAQLFGAHLDCVHIVPDTPSMIRRAISVEMSASMLPADAMRALMKHAEIQGGAARAAFSDFCQGERIARSEAPPPSAGVTASWRQRVSDTLAGLIAEARVHDLVVTGNASMDDHAPHRTDVSSLVMQAGRPILLAPPAAGKGKLRHVAVAWKNNAETARALTAAMPILSKAETIQIVAVNEGSQTEAECREGIETAARQLRWHGMEVGMQLVDAGSRSVAQAILTAAVEAGADLLVMGAYGHSRFREAVLGGFTQHVLDGVGLPVFLFH